MLLSGCVLSCPRIHFSQVVSVRENTEDESQQRILPTPVRPVAGTAPAGGSKAIATQPLPVTTALATVATTKATAAPKIVAVTVPNVPNVAVTVGNERGTAKDNTDLKQVELVRSRIKANPVSWTELGTFDHLFCGTCNFLSLPPIVDMSYNVVWAGPLRVVWEGL